jgi:hypothetical protein
MQYLAMLYDNEAATPVPGDPGWDEIMAGYAAFGEKYGTTAIRGGEALHPSGEAVTVRSSPTGAPLVTEGPFAETAEVVGGFYVLEADTLDEAISIASELPAAKTGTVELRPIVVWMDDNYLTPSDPDSRYLALILDTPLSNGVPGTPEWEEGSVAHGKFLADAGDAVIGGAALHPATTATTVRVRGDEVLVSDGPFAETAEVVGGFYLLRGSDRRAVTELASRIPIGPQGAIELWRVLDIG